MESKQNQRRATLHGFSYNILIKQWYCIRGKIADQHIISLRCLGHPINSHIKYGFMIKKYTVYLRASYVGKGSIWTGAGKHRWNKAFFF